MQNTKKLSKRESIIYLHKAHFIIEDIISGGIKIKNTTIPIDIVPPRNSIRIAKFLISPSDNAERIIKKPNTQPKIKRLRESFNR